MSHQPGCAPLQYPAGLDRHSPAADIVLPQEYTSLRPKIVAWRPSIYCSRPIGTYRLYAAGKRVCRNKKYTLHTHNKIYKQWRVCGGSESGRRCVYVKNDIKKNMPIRSPPGSSSRIAFGGYDDRPTCGDHRRPRPPVQRLHKSYRRGRSAHDVFILYYVGHASACRRRGRVHVDLRR